MARSRAQLVAAADSSKEVLERHAVALFDAYAAQRGGQHATAVAHARAAAEGFRRLRFPLLEAAAHEAAGDVPAALAVYRAYGAVGDVRRVTSALPVTAGAILSQRESQIAMLVARGDSNTEIARNLAISHKTVETHLGSVYQKLGFTSRTQLAAHVGNR